MTIETFSRGSNPRSISEAASEPIDERNSIRSNYPPASAGSSELSNRLAKLFTLIARSVILPCQWLCTNGKSRIRHLWKVDSSPASLSQQMLRSKLHVFERSRHVWNHADPSSACLEQLLLMAWIYRPETRKSLESLHIF